MHAKSGPQLKFGNYYMVMGLPSYAMVDSSTFATTKKGFLAHLLHSA